MARVVTRPFSLADWQDLAETEIGRVECVAGVLQVTRNPRAAHQLVAGRLPILLDRQRPLELVAVYCIDVLLKTEPLTVRAPDIVVRTEAGLDEELPMPGSAARLVVEVVEPHTRNTDRVIKMHEYAEAGIGEYWILEGDPLTLETYALEAGAYRLTGTHSGVAELTACGVPVRIDLDRLTDPGVNSS